ncbi:ABC transporter ATP-binding protein [Streptomonospora wellingtoniae]|uniref:ABC transporter ATP-binding protein n=1 Tax=Streptomonospora wellingtoniae TaxID=3075544 RepID=A0ABU2KNU1_9ACTN|nr:ABC transporter ATP-binding protein [Streptomonospora sp. DSM 45055]MDT0300940.1 ABC transporter ATP-binding protein [Streptomonospora sp. DSM 45055]
MSDSKEPATEKRASDAADAVPPPAGFDVVSELLSYRGRIASVVVLALLSTGGTLALPILMAQVIDDFGQGPAVAAWVAAMVAAALIGAVANALATYQLQVVGNAVILGARERVMRHSLGTWVGRIKQIGSGDLAARLTSDSARIKAAVETGLQLPMAAVNLIGTVVLMAVLDVSLLLMTVAAFAIASALVVGVFRALRRIYTAVQGDIGTMSERFVAALDAVTVIKAGRAEKRIGDELARVAEHVRGLELKAARLESLVVPTITFGQQVALVVVIIAGGVRVLEGQLDMATFAAFLLYMLQLAAPILMAATSMTTIQAGLVAQQRFNGVLSLPLEGDDDRPGTRPESDDAPAVRFEGVDYAYDGRPALSGADIDVPRRGLTAVVGRSGAGKSTVLGLIERFMVPTTGTVSVLGRATTATDLSDLRRRITYVDQSFTLLSDTVRKNLLLGAASGRADDELYAVLSEVGLAEAVRDLPAGLDTVLGGETDLSGGQRQRLALARAIAADTPLVLLDEPSSQLDGVNENRLRDTVRRLAADRAVVVVAHRLSTVREADHIVVLDEGRVVGQGSHDHLAVTSAAYTALLEGQGAAVGTSTTGTEE